MPELAYVNGVWSAIGEAKVSIEDRGFQFADGVYEVIVAYGDRLFRLPEHFARLQKSCDAIELAFDVAGSPLESVIGEGVRRSGLAETMIYVQITRGVAPRGHVFPDPISPTIVVTFRPKPQPAPRLLEQGASIKTVLDPRWTRCDIKAIALLPNVLAKNAALRDGYDDALFVGSDGDVREATTANFFMVRNGQLFTPPLSNHILHGVTRLHLLECARRCGIAVHEVRIDAAELPSASEMFLSNTTAEVLPVTRIDGRPVGDAPDAPGPVTRRLCEAFHKII